MTFRDWIAARQLLYEEQIGIHIRAKDNALSAEYAKSTARLRRQG